jgi:DNA-binding beta-propeller fold protein YncE
VQAADKPSHHIWVGDVSLKPLLQICAVAAAAFAAPAMANGPLYSLDHETALPSTDTDWDYSKLEPGGSRLFMARRKDGLVVYDVDSHRQIAVISNSIGANGPLLLPAHNRGYVAMTDGSLLSFDLKTLKTIDRVRLAQDGGLNGAMYDPSTGQIIVVTGQRPQTSTWYRIDPATGRLLGTKSFPFTKMDDPASDGRGNLFAPARYDNVILKLDAKTLEEKARWAVGDCIQPTAVEYQAHGNRLLVGCRGDKPVLLAIDADSGRIVATVPIGRGIDGLAIDERRHRVLTSNGVDANLSVIEQSGADGYRLLGNVMTRPNAKIMQIDERDGRLFIVTADHSLIAGDKGGAPTPYYHPNRFTVLTYAPR